MTVGVRRIEEEHPYLVAAVVFGFVAALWFTVVKPVMANPTVEQAVAVVLLWMWFFLVVVFTVWYRMRTS
jgi:hypothetical protein